MPSCYQLSESVHSAVSCLPKFYMGVSCEFRYAWRYGFRCYL